ncbi:hypothetical protein BG004_006663 [Podila humilis]|nr:hypothetical protein BG004_006663 [Podila humilis]
MAAAFFRHTARRQPSLCRHSAHAAACTKTFYGHVNKLAMPARHARLSSSSTIPDSHTHRSSNSHMTQTQHSGTDPAHETPSFDQCKNPIQLEKSIRYYIRSNPVLSDQALVAMLHACAELCRAVSTEGSTNSKNHHHHQHGFDHHNYQEETRQRHQDSDSLLLRTILDSFTFTPDQVLKVADMIHGTIAIQANPSGGPSTKVTNAYLDVCAVTGQFDKAYEVLQGMAHSVQGGVKPDLGTFRNTLRAAATAKRMHRRPVALGGGGSSTSSSGGGGGGGTSTTNGDNEPELNEKIDKVIELGTATLLRQARISFWMKLGLGGLAGATVGKFTTMGVMALPTNILGLSGSKQGKEVVEATMVIDTEHPLHGLVQVLTSSETAMGIGLTAGVLTAGYFVMGSMQKLSDMEGKHRVDEPQQQQQQQQHQHQHQNQYQHQHQHQHQLPRAKMVGMYFPDLATVNGEEIRRYLRRIVEN